MRPTITEIELDELTISSAYVLAQCKIGIYGRLTPSIEMEMGHILGLMPHELDDLLTESVTDWLLAD